MTPATFTAAFERFVRSERTGGILLAAGTVVALVLANSPAGPAWLAFWQVPVAGLTLQLWVNDGLMAIFFLLVGLELEREIYVGELRELRSAMLPAIAALGGLALPAAIHFAFNAGTPTQAGAGVPMATDIAFALAALGLAGRGVPASLKVFLTALAVIDDLAAIVVIGVAYAGDISFAYLAGALAVLAVLVALNRRDVVTLPPYLLGGAALWFLLLRSGVHPTIGGVMLAFAIPFAPRRDAGPSPSARLEHALHAPVAFLVLPVFALANAGVVLPGSLLAPLLEPNGLGIFLGLVAGKPVGIGIACFAAVSFGLCKLPGDLRWRHVIGGGFLAGIGFTMSIFIANLAFPGMPEAVDASKLAILAASLTAMVAGVAWLRACGARSR